MAADEKRSLTIWSAPAVHRGEPLVWGSGGARVIDLLDRIDAGDKLEDVADDFLVDRGSLSLLLELRDQLRKGGTDGD